MSSFIRNLQRKRLRQDTFTTDDEGNTVKVEHDVRPQATFVLSDGGYVTVRYTRGPITVSAARLRAQARLAEILHFGAMQDQARMMSRAFASADAVTVNQKRLDDLFAQPVRIVTRQMRRHALRKGLLIPTTLEQAAETAEKPKRVRKPRAKAAA